MNPDTERPHQPHHTGHRWFDLTITICILLVSVTSLIIAFVHSRTLERMADANARLVEANSWPFLAYSTGNITDNKPAISMSVVNDGVGPAKIEAVELKWKGVAYPNALEFLKACCGYQPNPGNALQVSIIQGRVLRAGESIQFIILPEADADRDAWKRLNANRLSADLNVNVCFCSVFDECWIEDAVAFSLRPKRVKQCTAPAVKFSLPN